jgi:hypothetical protein
LLLPQEKWGLAPFFSRLRSPIPIEEIASSLRSSQRPLSLSHGFFTIQPSPGVSMGMILFFSLFSDLEKVACPLFF